MNITHGKCLDLNMDINKIKMHLADATADLSYGRNKEKHLKIINDDLKEIANHLDANRHDPDGFDNIQAQIVGYLLYRMKEVASS